MALQTQAVAVAGKSAIPIMAPGRDRRAGIKPRAKRMLNRRRIEEKSAALLGPTSKKKLRLTAHLITAVTAMAAASLLEKNPEGEEYQQVDWPNGCVSVDSFPTRELAAYRLLAPLENASTSRLLQQRRDKA